MPETISTTGVGPKRRFVGQIPDMVEDEDMAIGSKLARKMSIIATQTVCGVGGKRTRGDVLEMWSPVRSMALLVKLTLPLTHLPGADAGFR